MRGTRGEATHQRPTRGSAHRTREFVRPTTIASPGRPPWVQLAPTWSPCAIQMAARSGWSDASCTTSTPATAPAGRRSARPVRSVSPTPRGGRRIARFNARGGDRRARRNGRLLPSTRAPRPRQRRGRCRRCVQRARQRRSRTTRRSVGERRLAQRGHRDRRGRLSRAAPRHVGRALHAEHEAECERLAAIGAGHRFAHARCMASEGQSFCESGDICGATTCLCTPTRACTPVTEVCVSDTPDGPRTCARACSDAR